MKTNIQTAIIFASIFLFLSLGLIFSQQATIFKNIKHPKNFSSILVAGSTDYAVIEFYYPGAVFENQIGYAPLVVRVNITPIQEGYQINKDEFVVNARVFIREENTQVNLKCIENYTEITEENLEEYISLFPQEIPNGTFYCYNPISFVFLKPLTTNVLNVTITPHIALLPSEFNISIELLSLYGIPIVEPSNVTDENRYTKIPEAYLEIKLENPVARVQFNAILYSNVFIEVFPSERPIRLYYVEISANDTLEKYNGVRLRFYYDDRWIINNNLDENNIRVYRYDETQNTWILINSFVNTSENYVETTNITKLGLFGIFTKYYTPQPLVQQITQYQSVPVEVQRVVEKIVEKPIQPIYYNITNITQPVIERVEKEVPQPTCGNNVCEAGENSQNCPEDCKVTLPTGLLILSEPAAVATIIVTSFLTAAGAVFLLKKLLLK